MWPKEKKRKNHFLNACTEGYIIMLQVQWKESSKPGHTAKLCHGKCPHGTEAGVSTKVRKHLKASAGIHPVPCCAYDIVQFYSHLHSHH